MHLLEKVEWFGGRYHESPWKQKRRIGTACSTVEAGTHSDVSQCFPSRCPALLGQVSSEMPGPPALWSGGGGGRNSGIEPFGTGGDTHTVPLRGARVKHLNSHLKSPVSYTHLTLPTKLEV